MITEDDVNCTINEIVEHNGLDISGLRNSLPNDDDPLPCYDPRTTTPTYEPPVVVRTRQFVPLSRRDSYHYGVHVL